jgi:hypothetical protein
MEHAQSDLRGAAVGEGLARVEQWNGREHLVVPVIGLVEGIVKAMNARGPELVPCEEFSKDVERWNGKPVYLGHPLMNGRPVYSNPQLVKDLSFGVVRNANITNKKLAMEAWLDAERCSLIAPALLERARAGDPIEISVGAGVHTEETAGTHAGRDYVGIWRNITPDHLALLPGDVAGACSFDMGCGIRAAQAQDARFCWPDKSGYDDHGRATNANAARAHERAATMHEAAGTAHAGATKPAEVQAAMVATRAAHEATVSAQVASTKSGHEHAMNLAANATNASLVAHTHSGREQHLMASTHHNETANWHYDAVRAHTKASVKAAQEDQMYERWLEAGGETDELLKTLRNIPQSARDKMDKADFAGPNESFPIEIPGDVHDAARSIGRAKGNPDAIKAAIIAIAYRKGASFVAQLPEAWKKKKDQKNASAFVRFMSGFAELLGMDDAELQTAIAAATPTEAEMTKCEIAKFLETATEDQLKALSAVAKPPTAEELKAAADKKTADEKKIADDKIAADLKVASDKKDATIVALKATGKNTLTDEALKALSQDKLDELVKAASAPKPPTFEELLAAAPAEVRASITAGVEKAQAAKVATIKVLRDSKRCDHTDEQLKAMSQGDLDKLVKLADIKAAVDYSGQGMPRPDGNAPQGVPPAPDLNAAIKAAAAKK